jgi:hypothetical protein
VKNWLFVLLWLPAVAIAQTEISPAEEGPDVKSEPPVNWVDSSHVYATDSAQALTEWLDEFFGDPLYDAERAESYLRIELIDDWDREDGNDFKVRLRGQVQLPKISQRAHLIFSGEESDALEEEERKDEDSIGIQFKVREGDRARIDLTMSYASSHLKPGIRYRNEGSFSNLYSYRLTQRIQYEHEKQFFSTTLADLNRAMGPDSALRWSNRFLYGENTDGVEWRTRLSLSQRFGQDSKRPLALRYFGVVTGVTRPDSFVKNYKFGVLMRRQMYRDFLFVELEPAYNLRRREIDDKREGQWSLVLRLEIALERDLRRIKPAKE